MSTFLHVFCFIISEHIGGGLFYDEIFFQDQSV